MVAIQLNFTLRTSGNVKTVHLVGSWDNYANQLPLSRDPSKSGAWKGTFRFPSTTLRQGQRYWYYYVLDGYHASHDPARDSVVEPTTSRRLNTLDVPASPSSPSAPHMTPSPTTSRRPIPSRPTSLSLTIPQGRPLPASSIVSPVPVKPGQQTRRIRDERFSALTMEHLTARLASQAVVSSPASPTPSSASASAFSDSDSDSDVPSLASSHASSHASSPSSRASSRVPSPTSSVSSAGSRCSCARFGITRAGAKVRIDCGGSRCGYDEEEEDDSGEEGEESCCEDEDEAEDERVMKYRLAAAAALMEQQKALRRRGMVLRG